MFKIILGVIGVFFIVGAFLTKTENGVSAVLFNIISFFSGAYCIAYALMQCGVIKIG